MQPGIKFCPQPEHGPDLVGKLLVFEHRGDIDPALRATGYEYHDKCILLSDGDYWTLGDPDLLVTIVDEPTEHVETPAERVTRLEQELADAKAALASEGLPEGWRWGEEDWYKGDDAPIALTGDTCLDGSSISWNDQERTEVFIVSDVDGEGGAVLPAKAVLAWAKRAQEWLDSREA